MPLGQQHSSLAPGSSSLPMASTRKNIGKKMILSMIMTCLFALCKAWEVAGRRIRWWEAGPRARKLWTTSNTGLQKVFRQYFFLFDSAQRRSVKTQNSRPRLLLCYQCNQKQLHQLSWISIPMSLDILIFNSVICEKCDLRTPTLPPELSWWWPRARTKTKTPPSAQSLPSPGATPVQHEAFLLPVWGGKITK